MPGAPKAAAPKGILDGVGPLEAGSSGPEDDLDPLETHLSAFHEAMQGGDMKTAADAFRRATRACSGGGRKEAEEEY